MMCCSFTCMDWEQHASSVWPSAYFNAFLRMLSLYRRVGITTTVVFYMDGVELISYPANCFTQEIGVDFDRETMEDWFTNEIPDHFIEKNPYEIDYIRAWKSSG